MVELGGLGKMKVGVNGAGLWVSRTEHYLFHARLDHGAGAHYAGLDGDYQNRTRKSVIAHVVGAVTQRENLGVRRRVVCAYGMIMTPADDLLVDQKHGANGHLAFSFRFVSFLERFTHPEFSRSAIHEPPEPCILSEADQLYRQQYLNHKEINIIRCGRMLKMIAL